jgi:S-adenosylmethionine hydrolase
VVDITHEVPRHGILTGALELAGCYRYFPNVQFFSWSSIQRSGGAAPAGAGGRRLPQVCALSSSSDHLEIAVNGSSAAIRLAIGPGARVHIGWRAW